MKNMILILTAGAVSLVSCSQDIPARKVPSVVHNTVKSTFANAVDIDWEKNGDVYEADFDINKADYKAQIDATGKLVMYKVDIHPGELPAAVATVISHEHSGYKIDDAGKLEKDGATYYQVELDAKGKKDKKLVFTMDGKPAQNISYM